MRKGALLWEVVLLVAVLGGALNSHAGDPYDPPRAQSPIEIVQRVSEQERGDETTIVDVKITNRGTRIAEDVELSGVEPLGYRLRAATATPTRDDEKLIWSLGSLKAGETRSLRLQWEPLANTADIPLKSVLRASHRAFTESNIEAPAKKVSAKLTVAVPETATVGVPVVVRIDVVNAGNRPIRDVLLQASFAPGLSHAMGKELENTLGTIDAGMKRSIPLEVIPTKAGELRGTARIRLASGGVSEQEFVVRAIEPTVALSIAAPARSTSGDPMHLKFTAANNGKEINRRVRLVVRFPTAINFLAASDGGTNVSDSCVYWDLGDIKPGQQRLVKLDTLAPAGGEHKVTAILSVEGREPLSHSIVVQVQGGASQEPAQGRRP